MWMELVQSRFGERSLFYDEMVTDGSAKNHLELIFYIKLMDSAQDKNNEKTTLCDKLDGVSYE